MAYRSYRRDLALLFGDDLNRIFLTAIFGGLALAISALAYLALAF